ncbi:ISAs1 family transposase [Mesorhizobium sp. AR07]|uniref:ISAs1 family transposase n=1 Tax=Mesorhizobium sp. AR07 TaxID=2865838 RepID=UPI00215F3110|nr:ISAs1 family transposase [Mesorhizobium sp. AR07]UVK42415.1 ISAs1 family transposase [Mesorhizobium sp. AR07]UVK43082.1 ISAs1 family transposase [Mesorhizobium sp. AR07]UVK46379.1 ISAs1 family transposase [Mesorhizobium sp. AR07]
MPLLLSILREVQDPRDVNARHDLAELLFLALAATLCGAKSCVDIADFVEGQEEELKEIVVLEHGCPSHDTFSRVFRLLDADELARSFAGFMAALRQTLGLSPPRGVVAVDGKALRRGYAKGRAFMPPLVVSVWDAETRLSIAAARAPEGDEVKATLDLLKSLDLKGCTVTADALHCRPDTAKALIGKKAHYALGLKPNRPKLFAAAERSFAQAGEIAFFETSDSAHGRTETRRASVLPLKRLLDLPGFPGLKAIGRIEASRSVAGGKSSTSVRYVALSKVLTPKRLAETLRAHWTIENQLHWSLDVVFHEDDARSRKDNAPQNLAVIRRLAQNILQAHPLDKPIASKMRRARWNKDFFFQLFTHMR